MIKRADGSVHRRDLLNRPNEIMNRRTVGSQMHLRGLQLGSIGRSITYNRMEFLAAQVPKGLTVCEYLVLLLDEEMERLEGSDE